MITGDTKTIIAWKSKAISDESIKPPTTASNSLAPKPNEFIAQKSQ